MRPVSLPFLFVFLSSVLCLVPNYAQETIYFQDDFNDCSLSPGWVVQQLGDTLISWEVGIPSNPKADSISIDGSCMLIIDDDLHGQNSSPTVTSFRTPDFDASLHRETFLQADIHFRAYEGSTFSILVWDGQRYDTLRTYDKSSGTGNTFADIDPINIDLSFHANAAMHIQFIYDDGGTWAWWAGLDNILVYGSGQGEYLSTENFNDCSLPSAWETEIVAGDFDWVFGYVDNSKASANSMNGSCFAFFDDDIIGNDAAPSIVRLYSPIVDGTIFSDIFLEFDVISRTYNELEGLTILLELDGVEVAYQTWLDDIGGPQFNVYERLLIDLSRYRARNMRIIFEYNDGGDWGWWIGLDDIRIWGMGEINDLCDKAIPIVASPDCLGGNNEKSFSESIDNSCEAVFTHSLWYRYEAAEESMMRLECSSDFNDGILIYKGDCTNLEEYSCHNEDEHGFEGEDLYFLAETGNSYFIRVCGVKSEFGNPTGNICLNLSQVASTPETPTNDHCDAAMEIAEGNNCVLGTNEYADFEGPEPELNQRSRHDVWYQFESDEKGMYRFRSNADFTDVLTLYGGECLSLEELGSSETGYELVVELPPTTVVLLQMSGYFSTIEGGYCLEVERLVDSLVLNEFCQNATELIIGGQEVEGDNSFSSTSAILPSCAFGVQRDLWYSFIAPESKGIQFWIDASFPFLAAVYTGDCTGDLEEIYCSGPLDRCLGYQVIEHLEAGEEYYLQLVSQSQQFGELTGYFTIHLEDIDETIDFSPLEMIAVVNCIETGKAILELDLTGGVGQVEILGRQAGDTLFTGQEYLSVATDEAGCIESANGLISCGGASYGCFSFAGEMEQQQLYLCEEEILQAGHAGSEIFDADDTYEFILFSGTCDQVDELIDRNKDGVFEYKPGILYGQTYYVSYVVGNEGISGKVDFQDSCLSIACGQPVVFYKSPSPFAGEDAAVCGLHFQAEGQESVGDGEWSLVEGPSEVVSFEYPNEAVSGIEVQEYGIYTFRWKEVNFGCEEEDWITIEFIEQPIADAGQDEIACGLEAHLQAIPSVGAGQWSLLEGPGSLLWADSSSAASGISAIEYGVYTLQWTEDYLGCTDQEDVIIWFVEQPIADAGSDKNVCDLTFEMEAIPSVGEGIWSVVQGPGQTIFENEIVPNTAVSWDAPGSYLMEWTEDNIGCADADEVRINVWNTFEIEGDTIIGADPDKEYYTIQFGLKGGFGSYTVVSANGTITENTFTSDPIACGEDYDITLSDLICGELRLAGSVDCDPTATTDVFENEIPFHLYPVPAEDRLFLEFEKESNEDLQLRITDQYGKTVLYQYHQSQPEGRKLELEVYKLPSGLYYLEITAEKKISVRKFVKR